MIKANGKIKNMIIDRAKKIRILFHLLKFSKVLIEYVSLYTKAAPAINDITASKAIK